MGAVSVLVAREDPRTLFREPRLVETDVLLPRGDELSCLGLAADVAEASVLGLLLDCELDDGRLRGESNRGLICTILRLGFVVLGSVVVVVGASVNAASSSGTSFSATFGSLGAVSSVIGSGSFARASSTGGSS